MFHMIYLNFPILGNIGRVFLAFHNVVKNMVIYPKVWWSFGEERQYVTKFCGDIGLRTQNFSNLCGFSPDLRKFRRFCAISSKFQEKYPLQFLKNQEIGIKGIAFRFCELECFFKNTRTSVDWIEWRICVITIMLTTCPHATRIHTFYKLMFELQHGALCGSLYCSLAYLF